MANTPIEQSLRYELYVAVGATVGQRIYPHGGAPQDCTFPYVTYDRVSSNHQRHQTGISGLCESVIQVDVWAKSLLAAINLSELIRVSLDSVRDDSFGEPGKETSVRSIALEDESSDTEYPSDGSDDIIHRRILTLRIWHTEVTSY